MAKRLDQLREQVSKLCGEVDVPEPGEFLTAIMGGVDPRRRDSLLYNYVQGLVRDQGPDVPPDADDWSFICDLILNSGRYQHEPVTLEQSYKAAETLMAYLHAKLKSMEVKADVSARVAVEHKLTEDEARTFFEIWKKEFA